jgi:flagellar hook-length control protein FliK
MPDISIPSSNTPAAPDARGANGDTRASNADASDAGAASVFGALLFAQIGVVPPPPAAATAETPSAADSTAGDSVTAATRAIPDWQTLVELATKDAGQAQAETASDSAAADPAGATTILSPGKTAVPLPGLDSDAKAQTASASFQALARDAMEVLGKKTAAAPAAAAADSGAHRAANRALANLAKHDHAAAIAASNAMAEQQSAAPTEAAAPTAVTGKNSEPGLDGARGAVTEPDARKAATLDPAAIDGANAANTSQAAQATLPVHDAGTSNTTVSLQTTVGSPAWTDELGHKVNYLVHGKMQTAELHLNPRELGPVSIQIKMETNQATLAFTAQHAETRQALEAALPRLRELLSDSGITLAQATVGGELAAQQQAFGDLSQQAPRQFTARSSASANSDERISAPGPAEAPTRARRGNGLVDTFA